MSAGEQRIAIAEACGWTDCHATAGLPCGIAPSEREHRQVPNYTNDLNAMHEAEKVLTRTQWHVYAHHLMGRSTHEFLGEAARTFAHATAAQRAESFLRAVGTWKEEA